MNEFDYKRAIKALPQNLRSQNDLWPGIERQLPPREGFSKSVVARTFWRVPAIAAAILITLTTGVFIGRGLEVPTPDQMSIRDYAMAGTAQNAELEFQAAFQQLVVLDYSGMQVAGNNPEALRSSWEDMQKAETSLLAALKDYPANRFLNAKLIELRTQQLQFAKQLVLLEQNNWRRT